MPPSQKLPNSEWCIYEMLGNGKRYIGSTTRPLWWRISVHKALFKRYEQKKTNWTSSFEVVSDPNMTYKVLEFPDVEDEKKLREIEDFWISLLDCINRNKAFISHDERKQQQRKWAKIFYYKNHEKEKTKKREYARQHKEYFKEKNRQYYYDHKEQMKEYQRQYRETHKEYFKLYHKNRQLEKKQNQDI